MRYRVGCQYPSFPFLTTNPNTLCGMFVMGEKTTGPTIAAEYEAHGSSSDRGLTSGATVQHSVKYLTQYTVNPPPGLGLIGGSLTDMCDSGCTDVTSQIQCQYRICIHSKLQSASKYGELPSQHPLALAQLTNSRCFYATRYRKGCPGRSANQVQDARQFGLPTIHQEILGSVFPRSRIRCYCTTKGCANVSPCPCCRS